MEHAEEQLYDVEGIARAPDLGGNVLDARGLEDLVHVRVAVEAEADGPRAEDDARRAELARHLRPYRAALEAVDVVHVAHGHRERAARRARRVVVLRLAVPDQPVPVPDDDQHPVPADLTLPRLLRHAPPDEREAVQLLELAPAERQNRCVLVAVHLHDLRLLLVLPLLGPSFSLRCIFGEQTGVVADDHARRERGEFGRRELFRVGEVEERIGRRNVGKWKMVDDF